MSATEVMFYHLEHSSLEQALPRLLEKCQERGWRVVVQAGSMERIEALDAHLWTYSDTTFLAHGTTKDGFSADQPIWLTMAADNPNDATVRFLVDRAIPPSDLSQYDRAVFMFSADEPEAVSEAREYWKSAAAEGHEVTYWRQNERGGWEKKA